jgi:hypothetical protein
MAHGLFGAHVRLEVQGSSRASSIRGGDLAPTHHHLGRCDQRLQDHLHRGPIHHRSGPGCSAFGAWPMMRPTRGQGCVRHRHWEHRTGSVGLGACAEPPAGPAGGGVGFCHRCGDRFARDGSTGSPRCHGSTAAEPGIVAAVRLGQPCREIRDLNVTGRGSVLS